MAELTKWRDGVLDRARLQKHETLLDVGSGDGLIAFGALERGAGEVVFTDISQDLLDECRRIATDLGVVDPCRFVLAPADDLSALEDESVDVVTTRSVLVYVRAKDRALAEFLRVLRPGGRISLFEPINRLYRGFRDSYDLTPVSQETEKVWALYDQLQPRDSDPMLDFDERDLVELAERVGFREVHLELRVDAIPATPRPWDVAARIAGNPNIPTLEEAIAETLPPRKPRDSSPTCGHSSRRDVAVCV